ncbi:SAM-dependent methyltransferase [Mycolicibacterium mucogenicum]|uniref:S-adenosyl-L-methionine-dependent methyltransferase n=1 Tax=Mycolicibacterium mucogenicum TaxID=56689 RepID=A0A1A3GWX4_MYCMU|nr:class I SAM-dependent methyltransferase [Mycolicibacterium mucogenicum]OBJ39844.1 SAM-dependent methyltransferase [Mycolicibacterium mucogenicum]
MARTDNDTWDLASSVGATATLVAAARALATNSEDPIIDDPFAAPLVRAVGVEFFTKLVDGAADPDQSSAGYGPTMAQLTNGMAARTRFFDDFFRDAGKAGIRQAVILAAGLDSRAYRLVWPAGTVVYEIDQPDVIEFKSKTLSDLDAAPTTERRTVAIDLREDWPTALRAAGLDPTKPTAWIAEGLFGYLPPEAQDRLLDQISELSAPGSRMGAEGVPATPDLDEDAVRERMKAASEHWRDQGFDLDFSDLVYLGDRADVDTYLQGHGWQTTAVTSNELLVRNGLPAVEADPNGQPSMGEVNYVTAVR